MYKALVYNLEMHKTEQQIIRKAASGDREAFRELVLEHSHAMFRLAWRLTGNASTAEDIVQETFIKVWKKIGTFRAESSFRSWLHRITVNTAMDYLRKQSRRNKFEVEDPKYEQLEHSAGLPSQDMQIDISKQIEVAMRHLTKTERSALMLRHFEGHSINEISEILEITTGACKQAIFRGVKKMRIALQPLVTT